MFDLTDVGFVKRIRIGSADLADAQSDDEAAAALDLLNRCLADTPRGRLIGIERGFQNFNVGEHQVVLQNLTYHVGFARQPQWLDR